MSTATKLKIEKSDAEWRSQLTEEQYHVTREHGTERAFTGPNWNTRHDGLYRCVCCGKPLFSSEAKFEFRHRLAELLCAGRGACGRRVQGPLAVHDAHRNPLRGLRRTSRPCVRGRPRADRPALLHERHRAEIREGRAIAASPTASGFSSVVTISRSRPRYDRDALLPAMSAADPKRRLHVAPREGPLCASSQSLP